MAAHDNLHPSQFVDVRGMDYEQEGRALGRVLGVKRREAKRTIHPRSGYSVKVGRAREVAQPQGEARMTATVPGPTMPPTYNIVEHGHINSPGIGSRVVGQEPIKYAYRGMSHEEWGEAQKRGSIESDRRGVIASWEGTNAAADPQSAVSYLPSKERQGVIAKIRLHPDEEWFTTKADSYLRTQKPIPLERVVRATRVQK